jgi:hypothetical protein
MAQIHYQALYTMSAKGLSIGLLKIMKSIKVLCKLYGKEAIWKVDPTKSQSRARSVLQLIHTNFYGPFSIPSLFISKYFVTFMDDFNRNTWVIFFYKNSMTCLHLRPSRMKWEKKWEK